MKRCEECQHPLEVEPNAVRRYELGGLPHVELHGVRVTRCPGCGAEDIRIPRIAQLHQVLAEHFIHQPRPLAPVEARFLRKHMGLSTADYARCMGVTRETVSRWETGAKPMGPQADRLLRLLVATTTPCTDYAAKDALSEIDTSRPTPKRPGRIAVTTGPEGWRA